MSFVFLGCTYMNFIWLCISYLFFFFNDTATTEIYTLSLHDALPISLWESATPSMKSESWIEPQGLCLTRILRDRKSTRLNSSHGYISYAVFCLKKKKRKGRQHSCT